MLTFPATINHNFDQFQQQIRLYAAYIASLDSKHDATHMGYRKHEPTFHTPHPNTGAHYHNCVGLITADWTRLRWQWGDRTIALVPAEQPSRKWIDPLKTLNTTQTKPYQVCMGVFRWHTIRNKQMTSKKRTGREKNPRLWLLLTCHMHNVSCNVAIRRKSNKPNFPEFFNSPDKILLTISMQSNGISNFTESIECNRAIRDITNTTISSH